MSTVTWTGERCRNAGLLYQNYENRAVVRHDNGAVIGEVLHLPNGYYSPRVPNLAGEECATLDSAVREVERLHKTYRS